MVQVSSGVEHSVGVADTVTNFRNGSSTHDVTTNLPLPMVNVTTAPFSVQAGTLLECECGMYICEILSVVLCNYLICLCYEENVSHSLTICC